MGRIDPALRGTQLTYLAGVISKEDSMRFKRMVFRATRGNNWTYMIDIRPGLFLDSDPLFEVKFFLINQIKN